MAQLCRMLESSKFSFGCCIEVSCFFFFPGGSISSFWSPNSASSNLFYMLVETELISYYNSLCLILSFLLDISQPCGTWIEGSGHSLDVLSIHQVVYNVWNHLMVLKRLGCWSIINAQAGLIRAVDWPSLHGLLCGTHLMPSLGYGAPCTCNVSTWSCMKKEFLLILTFQLLGCKLQPTRVYCLKRWIPVLGYECSLSSKKILLVSIFFPFLRLSLCTLFLLSLLGCLVARAYYLVRQIPVS